MNLYRMGAVDEARRMIDDAIAYCVEERVEVFLRTLEFFRFATMEDRQKGYAGLRALIDPMRERNRYGMFVPTLAGLCAELAIEHGEAEHALMTVEYAQRAAEATGELIDLADIHALRGRIMQMGGELDRSAAIAAFRAGLDRSAENGARFPELKNAVGLAEVLVEAGDPDEARKVLAPRYQWFDHGHELPLLRRARALLDELD